MSGEGLQSLGPDFLPSPALETEAVCECECRNPKPQNLSPKPRYLIHNKDREHSAAMSLLSNQKEEAMRFRV